MRKNKIKELLHEGKVVSNGWLHIPNSWAAEVMAHAGWDSVTVDMQHGLMGIETAIQMMQAISTSEAIPMARVTWNDAGQMMRLLDGGAYGIICPMINSAADCERFISACKYPPEGIRSFGPTRARVYGGMDYADHANEEIMTFAMIETKESMENIEAILSVKGLDAIFVGSGDLKLSLTGKAGHATNSPLFDEAIDKIRQCLPVGARCSLPQCQQHNTDGNKWECHRLLPPVAENSGNPPNPLVVTRTNTGKTCDAVFDIGGITDFAHLTITHNVDARLYLPCHYIIHRYFDRFPKNSFLHRFTPFFCKHQIGNGFGTRKAAHMCG
jgi:4-hydroxy-2-oxoheptanedioate aldolase